MHETKTQYSSEDFPGVARKRRFADRVADIQPFHVVAVLTRATELAAAGRDIIHLAGALPRL